MKLIFACGNAFEPWSPRVARTRGVGGSEHALIAMTARLAAQGHEVHVYANLPAAAPGEPPSGGEVFDGVAWWPTRMLLEPASPLACDVLVLWRNAGLVEAPVDANARILWVHDVLPMHLTMERLARIDRVLALSQWHKGVLVARGRIPPEKIIVTRNGIDVAAWAEKPNVRVPRRAVYLSAPDRGLAYVLAMWPRIRERVPDAELAVLYGFESLVAQARATGDSSRLLALAVLEQKANETRGVLLLGRQPHGGPYERHLARAGAWLYPTNYEETSCIAAMEAQAAGLRIVTSALAALRETVGSRGVLVPGKPHEAAYQDAFVNAAAHALDPSHDGVPRDDRMIRAFAMRHAERAFDWAPVVDQWEALFAGLLAGTKTSELLDEDGRNAISANSAAGDVLSLARSGRPLPPAEAPHEPALSPERPCRVSGRWADDGAGFSLRCPPDMESHVLEVLQGCYDVPGLAFETPPRVLDIGACVGDFAIWAAHRWPGAILHLYEPNPRALDYLHDNVPIGATVHPVAVRARGGKAMLHFGPHNLGESSFVHHAEGAHGAVLVGCIAAGELPECDILKIDTEGCEVEILDAYNARRWERRPRAVLLEFHSEDDRKRIDERMRSREYSLVRGRIVHAGMGTLCYVRSTP